MNFTTGDTLWDIGVYGVTLFLFAFTVTAMQAGNLYFGGLCLLALFAELRLIWVTYVPLLAKRVPTVEKDGDFCYYDRDEEYEREYERAQKVMKQSWRDFRKKRRKQRQPSPQSRKANQY
jgi:hypothetical protein